MINVLAYADDLVLMAPSWRAMQTLLSVSETAASQLDMTFNTKKTVVMVFSPCKRSLRIADVFPTFVLAGCTLAFVAHFKYLGHIIENSLSGDQDINREIKLLFTRTNVLIRRFKRCSTLVKIRLFRSYCLCFYGFALWFNYSIGVFNRLSSCYSKCLKSFFGYSKYSSVTHMLLDLGLPSFNTLVINHRFSFDNMSAVCNNALVSVVTDCC